MHYSFTPLAIKRTSRSISRSTARIAHVFASMGVTVAPNFRKVTQHRQLDAFPVASRCKGLS